VTARTVLHRTRAPLTQWLSAAYLVTTHTPGLSALQLQRQLGIGRYETAWSILHKLRRAMVRPGRDPLRRMGYRHRPRPQGCPRRAGMILHRIHRVFGNLQAWLRGTHHGVSAKHLQDYLDGFTFRFNRRPTPMAAFQTLLGLGSQQQASLASLS
jgi:hypothetical protein